MNLRARPKLTRNNVIGKCQYFSAVGIWPSNSELNPELWLNNFLESEIDHALCLLDAFTYFNTRIVDEVFNSAVWTLGRTLSSEQWQAFVDCSIFTIVTGETPNIADSGHMYARKTRALGIPDERLKHPAEVSQLVRTGFTGPIVFVDDFVGTGNQFEATWSRGYGSPARSFAELASTSPANFFYCPAFCTQFGLDRINSICPGVTVNPGHLIPNNYSALTPDSVVWPDDLIATANEFLRLASIRAGIPDTDWRGFGSLGLSLAIQGSVPDATLPIFTWDKYGWHPLILEGA